MSPILIAVKLKAFFFNMIFFQGLSKKNGTMMVCFELHNLTRSRNQTKKKTQRKGGGDAIRLATTFVETVPLVLLALHDDRAQVVLALLVVGTVRTVTVWPLKKRVSK